MIVRPDLILLSLLLGACSGAEFAGSGASSATDGKDQKTMEQPSEVAGGFGLACEPSELSEDPAVSGIGCIVADKSGNKFKDSMTLKLEILVTNGDSKVDATLSAYEEPFSFKFTIPKTEASNVMILSKFTTPEDSATAVLEKNYKLTDVLSNPITDTSASPGGNDSTAPDDDTTATTPPPIIGAPDAPTLVPPTGAYESTQSVVMSTATPGSTIHFTEDSSTPTCSSKQYVSAVQISDNAKIKAISCLPGAPNSTVTVRRYIFSCGDSTSSCYGPMGANLPEGSILTVTGAGLGGKSVRVKYVKADSTCVDAPDARCFRVWQDVNSNKIINASGIWSSANTWQKKLSPDGKSKTATDFTAINQLAGRVCPPNVYVNDSDKFVRNRCLYYQKDNGQKQPFLGLWCAAGERWFKGNVKSCSDHGMRIPTLYETNATGTSPAGRPYPTSNSGDQMPEFAGAKGMPTPRGAWTATTYWDARGCLNNYFTVSTFQNGVTEQSNFTIHMEYPLLCVLPQ